MTETLELEAPFSGELYHEYTFRVQARDLVGHTSDWITTTVAIVSQTKYYFLEGRRVAMRKGDQVYYLYGDHLGSTSLATDENGEVVYKAWYLPYGGERLSDGISPTDFGFTDQRNEVGLGLMDYNARYYDPVLSRFISPDTVVPGEDNPQAWNRYSYTFNNPMRYTDSSGHCPPCDDPLSPLRSMWREAFGSDRPGYSPAEVASDLYISAVVGAAEAVWGYDSTVNKTLRYYEIDRFVDEQDNFSFRSEGSLFSGEGLTVRHSNPYVTLEANAAFVGGVIYGNGDSTGFGVGRSWGDVTAIAGTTEMQGNFFEGPIGQFSTTSQLPYNTGQIQIAGRPLPPINYQVAAAHQTNFSFDAGILTGELKPTIAINGTYHGGPTAATVAVLFAAGAAVIPEAVPLAAPTLKPLLEGGIR